MRLSNGKKVAIEANSAAEAIEEALWKNRGCTAEDCHSGLAHEEAYVLQKAGIKAVPGLIWHDIPPHVAIHPDAPPPPKKTRKSKDDTAPMFNEAEIIAESKTAKDKADYGREQSKIIK